MQVSGGHLLAAGKSGGNTKISSSPVAGTSKKEDTPRGILFSLTPRADSNRFHATVRMHEQTTPMESVIG